ncbi:Voltage-gated Ion Channel (VIC) Superfamily [Phytophthora palmivora]|uniref:Voltage-gated Ion Channel (VIC) Superfamily n=1 Tax=Phytophthora palmivora TaxID=4796 RepID=A0A2P4YKX4_9STRA|nr:Voltage-gated Ion Channel (VIC) Superfamily [Phytophthora palmivora]
MTKKPYKLPEGIVWPPGMEEECIARLGLDGHHPIAPPGLEHLVTEEQWGDYWTWLHWYSSWQMWYMKNGKKPKRKSDTGKRSGRRHAESDKFHEIEAQNYSKQESLIGWRLQQLIMFLLFINIGVMAAETVDGPRYGSSDPGYPYMPEDNFFNAVEAFFSFIYVIEFAVRWSTMPNQTYFWKSTPTWINFLAAIAALPRLAGLAINAETSLAD